MKAFNLKSSLTIAGLFILMLGFISCSQTGKRETISLNGTWDFTVRESNTGIPENFDASIPVPGLGDLASIEIDSFGLPYSFKRDLWYRKTFQFSQRSEGKITLKLHKVKFGHTVYLNGREVGSSSLCFAPVEYDISDFVHPGDAENEIIIRVGAFKDNLDEPVVWGADFEKIRYFSGIYDDVELIISGNERINNLQIAPDTEKSALDLGLVMKDRQAGKLNYSIAEKASKRIIKKGKIMLSEWTDSLATCSIPFENFRYWTPEDPFLYELTVTTSNDEIKSTFGMRDFTFNTETKRAELNGETYYLRGTNVCIFRFFEDPDRKGLPWDTAWVRDLHRKFKSMHWNSIRYCISAPPRFWYDIADEEGLMIQDEYPVWTGIPRGGEGGFEGFYPGITAESLAEEYRSWMMEKWNHPSIVIWDAQNESVTEITGEAIEMVRDLDMSGRPWENGWARPQDPADPIETHPYRFTKFMGRKVSDEGPLKEVISTVQVPDNGPSERMPLEGGGKYPNPIIINEYGWLWLNRDGSTTTLTDHVYPNAFGRELSTSQRLEIYGRHLGILTEYWRAHRTCAGVLHFCGLGYSRSGDPRGQTSDHFTNINELTFEDNFVEYVKPAFNPVGLFLDWFEQFIPAESDIEVPFIIINDLDEEIKGSLKIAWIDLSGEKTVHEEVVTLKPFGKNESIATVSTPSETGGYELVLSLSYGDTEVTSRRLCSVTDTQ